MHAFRGRAVANAIIAMEANHPHLTTQKSFYVDISRARDRAELVVDDAKALREQLVAVIGERNVALDAVEAEFAKRDAVELDGSREHGRDGVASVSPE